MPHPLPAVTLLPPQEANILEFPVLDGFISSLSAPSLSLLCGVSSNYSIKMAIVRPPLPYSY